MKLPYGLTFLLTLLVIATAAPTTNSHLRQMAGTPLTVRDANGQDIDLPAFITALFNGLANTILATGDATANAIAATGGMLANDNAASAAAGVLNVPVANSTLLARELVKMFGQREAEDE